MLQVFVFCWIGNFIQIIIVFRFFFLLIFDAGMRIGQHDLRIYPSPRVLKKSSLILNKKGTKNRLVIL